jgi:hypothetical protein
MHQGVLCEAVCGVVDGDDGVGDDRRRVGPRIGVAGCRERGSFHQFESERQVVGFACPRCSLGFADAGGELFDVAAQVGADLVATVLDVGQQVFAVGVQADLRSSA